MASIFIVLTGAVVRVTGSGLGCPTWPACESGSLTTTPALGIHGLIEFGNRMLTGALILTVGWAIVAARLQRFRNRMLTRLAWSQFWLVVVNSIAGGVSVLTGLNPYVVAMHFLLAMALLTATTLTWHRARQAIAVADESVPAGTAQSAGTALERTAGWVLLCGTLALVVLGTLVTGSGQHSGDSALVPRMNFVWSQMTVAHGVLGVLVLVVAIILLASLRRRPDAFLARRRAYAFLAITLAQAAVGVIQVNTGVPAALVALHVLGSALVWVGVLRLLLDLNPSLLSALTPTMAGPAAPRGLPTSNL